MKKIFFLFALLASMTASAAVTVTPLSVDYSNKIVTFSVSWPGDAGVDRVWVWIDLSPITGTSPGTFEKAVISEATANVGSILTVSGNTRGFYVTTNPTTVTATLNNVPGQFNWCVYGSDAPPKAVVNAGSGYALRGTKPFTINGSQTVNADTFGAGTCITSITDATGCPGLVEELSAPTSSTNGSRCNAGTVTVSATPPANCTIDWYTTASGSTIVANGTGVTTLTTPAISTTTDYYAASRHLYTGCVSSDRTTVTAAVTNSSGRDELLNSCNCASGLTLIGSYCRDLVADQASTYTGCGIEIKAANQGTLTSYGGEDYLCPGGWRYPTCDEGLCMNKVYTTLGFGDGGSWKHDVIVSGGNATNQPYFYKGNTSCSKETWSTWSRNGGYLQVRCVRN
ncbi:MAG: hypothetical protein LBG31_04195 [Prevotellaceae bacterium]|jgi:hypothetical protein|nr:hypothetical protein [Prevotellaceae bacterium]